jgi:uncharacterized protein
MIPLSFAAVELKGFVNDYADIIDEQSEQELNSMLEQIYDSGIAEYSIVTVKSLEGKDIESYSLEIAQGKLGDKEKNNGLLLLVALDDREYRFEVGRGIEYILTDAKTGIIGRQYIVPNFKNRDYGKGIVEASAAIKKILLNESGAEEFNKCECTEEQVLMQNDVTGECSCKDFSAILPYIIIGSLFVFAIFGFVIFIAVKYGNKQGKNKYFNAATAAIILFGGRGGSGGGHSGGFGGFGGGNFGGGGSGGSW